MVCLPVVASHTRIVASASAGMPPAHVDPSAETTNTQVAVVRPKESASCRFPVVASHVRIVPSCPPETIVLLFGVKANVEITPICAVRREKNSRPVVVSHTWRMPAEFAVARVVPLGENANTLGFSINFAKVVRNSPVVVSHRRSVPSLSTLARIFPSSKNVNSSTLFVYLLKVRRSR